MNWIVLLFYFETAFLPTNGYWIQETALVQSQPTISTEFGIEARFVNEHLFVGGSVKTLQSPVAATEFMPTAGDFYFNAGMRLKGLEAGFRHRCVHPIMPYVYHAEQSANGRATVEYEGAYEELYLRVQVKQRLF